jgi:hypothetical protein
VNNGRMRAFTSRNDDAHSSSVVSIDAPLKPIRSFTQEMGSVSQNATVGLEPIPVGSGNRAAHI